MKTYTYKFVDGTKSIVEVEDSLYNLLIELDRQEKYGNRRETRRHISLESLAELNIEPTVTDEYFTDDILSSIDNERLQEGVSRLLPTQRDLLYRLFIEQKTVTEIAMQDGIAVCSVSKKMERIYKKLKNFL